MFLSPREKDEDEGIPSETEEDKRLMESKAKELRGKKKKHTENTKMCEVCVCEVFVFVF